MEKSRIRELLHYLDNQRRRLMRPEFLELGLTVGEGQPRILKTLLEQGPMTQRELSDRCMLDAATMSRTLDKLEAAGLLERKKNPSCRRSYLICITEEGKEKAVLIQEKFRELDQWIWEGIPEEEMEQLCGTLEKIRKNLETKEKRI